MTRKPRSYEEVNRDEKGLEIKRRAFPPIEEKPVLKDVNKTIYSATKIYELTSASIRTSTTSGVVHVMLGSPPSIFQRYTLYRKHLLVHAYKVS